MLILCTIRHKYLNPEEKGATRALNQHVITFLPEGNKIPLNDGKTLKDAITEGGLHFDFPCGGKGTCGKCRVKIINQIIPPTREDQKFLDEKDIAQGVRLACHTAIHGDLTVQFDNDEVAHNILLASEPIAFGIDPLIVKSYVKIDEPSMMNQRSDWTRLKEALGKMGRSCQDLRVSLPILHDLPELMRSVDYRLTVITEERTVLGIERHDTKAMLLGVALDIGTTTIVGYLLDLYTGKELAVASSLNPQVKFGADVISRIAAANKSAKDLKSLQAAVVSRIDTLMGEMAGKAGVTREDIYAVTVAGNTCMSHLFLGINPKYLAVTPYVAVTGEAVVVKAIDLHIHINPAGQVFVLPNIAGFVGGDTVAVVLATGMDQSTDIRLAIDIGTNGEIVLGSKERLIACSAAAGPAFEGAHISSGMRGAQGAIDHVELGERLAYSVIGDTKPQGICGSGLLDAAAGLIELGIINKRGKILSPPEVTNLPAEPFLRHIVEFDGANAFLLVPEVDTAHGRPIMVTQEDIVSIQLAKGAIAAGVNVLIETLGIGVTDIKEVLLAGAFGNYMAPRSACIVGLIPPELAGRTKAVGNAAGLGAKIALLSRKELDRTNSIAGLVQYVELAAHQGFSGIFAKNMRFI